MSFFLNWPITIPKRQLIIEKDTKNEYHILQTIATFAQNTTTQTAYLLIMKKDTATIRTTAVAIICLVSTISLVITSWWYIQKTTLYIQAEIPALLEEAAIINCMEKTKQSYMASSFNVEPGKNGTYTEKTFQNADTTFKYHIKIVDMETERIRHKQSSLLLKKELHSKDIQLILDSLLYTKNIHIPTIVGITASFYTKLNEWSGDTLSIQTSYKTVFAQQGIFEDIDYHVYADIPFTAVWRLMPHTLILSLLFITLLTAMATGYALSRPRTLPTLKENMLIIGPYKTKLPPQMKTIMEMLLTAEGYRVRKEEIKNKFWPTHTNSGNNMTTAIDRLNKILSEISNKWTVVTDSVDENYYKLIKK